MKFKKCFCFVIFYSSFFLAYTQTAWKLEKESSGVKVYTRFVDFSPFKEYKATTFIKAPIDSIVDKIIDGNHLKDWNFRTTKSSLIEKNDNGTYYLYMYNDLPWPAKNRDHISELKLEHISDSLIKINIKSVPDKIHKKKNVIRVLSFYGFWLLEKTDKGVRVMQQMFGDPGGVIPVFIVNTLVVEASYTTLKKFQAQFKN